MKERNYSIDILKVIGILCIVLAHVCESKVIMQLRNFDVPLMVICSAYLYKNNDETLKININKFIYRCIRLAVPVWIFFTLFFLIKLIFFNVTYSFYEYFTTYTFIGGIGYVWIIRVYILTAMCLPIFYKIKNRIKSEKLFDLSILVIYVLYEVVYFFIGDVNIILQYVVYYMIPYGILCTWFANKIKEKKNLKVIFIVCVIIYVVLFVALYMKNNTFVITSDYKYPARMYYLSYAFIITIILWWIIEKKKTKALELIEQSRVVAFISSHTMWIYLWHIAILEIVQVDIFWGLKFIIVSTLSIVITWIQSKIIKQMNLKNKTILRIFDS